MVQGLNVLGSRIVFPVLGRSRNVSPDIRYFEGETHAYRDGIVRHSSRDSLCYGSTGLDPRCERWMDPKH